MAVARAACLFPNVAYLLTIVSLLFSSDCCLLTVVSGLLSAASGAGPSGAVASGLFSIVRSSTFLAELGAAAYCLSALFSGLVMLVSWGVMLGPESFSYLCSW